MPDPAEPVEPDAAAADEQTVERQASDDANEAAHSSIAGPDAGRTYAALDRDEAEPLAGDADERVRRLTGDE